MRTVLALTIALLAACDSSSPAPVPLQHVEFPQLCDAKAQLIRSTCERDARCGAIDANQVDSCVSFIAQYFGWSGCGFVPAFGDDTYRGCFDAIEAMDCVDVSAEPSQCDGIFVADYTQLSDSAPELP